MALRILAFDTSTQICSVALMVGNNIYECSGLISYQHEKEILSMIDNLLLNSGITLRSLDCLAFSCGPGSFVGVRIGVGLAQGLSLGIGLPLVQVSSLEILAEGIWRLSGARRVLSTVDARLGELYFACYYRHDNGCWLQKDAEIIVVTPADMCRLISKLQGKWVLVGTGWNHYPILFADDILQIDERKVLIPSARDILSLAAISVKNGNVLSVDQVRPVYLDNMKWKKFFNRG